MTKYKKKTCARPTIKKTPTKIKRIEKIKKHPTTIKKYNYQLPIYACKR